MKKIGLVVFVFVATLANAQVTQQNTQPQISVSGEGKISVTPDRADITVGIENVGADAAEVKKKNDATVDAVIKYLKSIKLPAEDYQTQRVSLNRNYDNTKKKYSFVATQTIVIRLKDITKYDAMMMGLVDAGINSIQGIEFKTSKQAQYESEARVKAVEQAKLKANDYAAALNQKVGKAITVTDNTQTYYPRMMSAMKFESDSMAGGERETLAIGEITVTANVNISFELN
ncbi:26 kDa periplasmic immunogenic protein precursor [compost metagenome]